MKWSVRRSWFMIGACGLAMWALAYMLTYNVY